MAEAGVVTLASPGDEDLDAFAAALAHAVAQHRQFDRQLERVPACPRPAPLP